MFWDEMTGQQIYDNFQQGAGPQRLSEAAVEVNKVASRYHERAQQISDVIRELDEAWQGAAAGGAKRGAGPLLTEHVRAGLQLQTAQDLSDRQSGSFSDARNKVVPVPPAPGEVPPFGPLVDPGGYVSYRQQVQQHNAAARHNVDVMDSYTGASTYNTDGMPTTFGDLGDDQPTMTVGPAPTTIDPADPRDTGRDEFVDTAGDGGPPGSTPPPSPRTESGGAAAGAQDPLAPRPDATPRPGGTSAGGATTPGGYVAGTGGPAGIPGGALSGGDVGTGPGRPTGGGIVPGVGVAFPGPGSGGGGAHGTGGVPTGGPRGAGPITGVGPQEPGARSTPAGVAGAGRGGAGVGGVPVGAGRGRGDEDSDRKTPEYLEGGDPYELFDSDLLVAPPIIGEDED